LKKLGYDAVLFWTLGETPGKSLLISLVQLPLIGLFIASLLHRRYRQPDIIFISATLIVCFYLAHLPTIALARYSVVLVPSMLIVAVGAFASSSHRDSIQSSA
jgi:hypothetical protein